MFRGFHFSVYKMVAKPIYGERALALQSMPTNTVMSIEIAEIVSAIERYEYNPVRNEYVAEFRRDLPPIRALYFTHRDKLLDFRFYNHNEKLPKFEVDIEEYMNEKKRERGVRSSLLSASIVFSFVIGTFIVISM